MQGDGGDGEADDLGRVLRWEAAGGSWWAMPASGSGVTVVLARCDGGEEVERFDSRNPRLHAYVEARTDDTRTDDTRTDDTRT